jgi:hypothetical protein
MLFQFTHNGGRFAYLIARLVPQRSDEKKIGVSDFSICQQEKRTMKSAWSTSIPVLSTVILLSLFIASFGAVFSSHKFAEILLNKLLKLKTRAGAAMNLL